MSKRQHVEDIEDWGRIIDEVLYICQREDRPLHERIHIARKMRVRVVYLWTNSHDDFELIWRMRWERINRMYEGLKFALELEIVQVLL